MPTFAELYVGSYDGSTWTEREKVLAIGTDVVTAVESVGLAASKGSLVVGSSDDEGSGSAAGKLVAVPGTDLTGTYASLDSGTTVKVRTRGGGLTPA